MSQVSPGAAALFRHPPFLLFFTARAFSRFCYQIGAVAVGWQVYALTNSALDLGLIGLTQFVPMALLVFVAGHAADRFDRRRVAQMSQIVAAATAAFLAYGSFAGWLEVPEIFAAVAVLGMTAAFESPTTAAMLPLAAPGGMLQRATAVSSATVQVATIIGPALGGLAYAVSPGVPYAIIAVVWLVAAAVNGAIRLTAQPSRTEPPTLASLFAGVGFVRRNPLILGSISLDLFAVLLGGVTALMPIYARDILNTGPWGLGLLRSAPAVGALSMSVLLARHAIERRA